MKDEARALKVTTAGLKVFERNDKKASPPRPCMRSKAGCMHQISSLLVDRFGKYLMSLGSRV